MTRAGHHNNFDIIRLFAASQVLLMHAIWWLKLPPMQNGVAWLITAFPGVPIFFCISGFLVSQSFHNCKGGLTDFWSRRALRIYPGLWVHFGVILILLTIGGALSISRLFSLNFWGWVAAAFALGSDFYGFYFAGSPFDFDRSFYQNFPSGVLWTISVELGFYVLTPLVFTPFLRERWLANLSLSFWGACSLATAIVVNANLKLLPASTVALFSCLPFSYFWVFLIGAALYVNWDHVAPILSGKAWLWISVYIASAYFDADLRGVSVLDYQKPDIFVVVRMILLSLATISMAFTFRSAAKVLRGNDLSYGIYLYHMPIVATFLGFGISGNAWLYAAIPSLTVVVALASWLFVERPALAAKAIAVKSIRASISSLPLAYLPTLPTRLRFLGGNAFSLAAACFVVASFWSYASSHQVEGLNLSPIFSLQQALKDDHWQAFPSVSASVSEGAIVFQADDSKYGYQVMIKDIAVEAGQSYLLRFDIRASPGKLGIAVVKGATGELVIGIYDVHASLGVVRFTAPSDKVQLVVFNNNPQNVQSEGRIASFLLSRVM